MHLRIIAAVDFNGAIGAKGGIPWRAPADMARFKRLTMGNYVLFGRKTYESLPKALAGRELIVLTRRGKTKLPHGGEIVFDLGQVVAGYAHRATEIFVGGGADVYRLVLPLASSLEITVVHTEAEGADTFFPPVDLSVWKLTSREDRAPDEQNPPMSFLSLVRICEDRAPITDPSGPPGCWKTALDTLRPQGS